MEISLPKKKSTTQSSIDYLTELGYLCDVVEKTIPHTFIKKDLYGFIDILCIRENEVLGVQTTSRVNILARSNKIAEHKNVDAVRKAGIKIHIHGWAMVKGVWTCKIVDVS